MKPIAERRTKNIIDTHMHLWDLKNDYPWLKTKNQQLEQLVGNYDKIKNDFLVRDYLAVTQNYPITKSVHLQALGFSENPDLETKWLQEQFQQFGFPHGIVAYANLADPEVENLLVKHCQYQNMRGIRMILNYHDIDYLKLANRDDYMRDPQWHKGFSLLEKYNLTFDASIYDHQIKDLAMVAKAYPNTNIVIEHLAWPLDETPAGFRQWKNNISLINDYPNVYMKLSGLGCGILPKIDAETRINYIKTAIELFSVDRCMFGSNCPPDLLFYDLQTLMAFFDKAFANYSEADRHKLYYQNAADFYRLD